jgi:hypothetical protein
LQYLHFDRAERKLLIQRVLFYIKIFACFYIKPKNFGGRMGPAGSVSVMPAVEKGDR